jgi:hypothetical protein
MVRGMETRHAVEGQSRLHAALTVPLRRETDRGDPQAHDANKPYRWHDHTHPNIYNTPAVHRCSMFPAYSCTSETS